MKLIKKQGNMYIAIWIITGIVVIITIAGCTIMNRPSFGRIPRGERLERIKRSPNYRDDEFQNLHKTPMMTSDKSRFRTMWDFLFRKSESLRPDKEMSVIKTDLRKIKPEKDALVWFGHSSYLIQVAEKRILVDPVFYIAAPVSFVNKPFKGTNIYKPQDMPDIDYLVISHDHWDHLDYHTITALKDRIKKVICPLGVGEHFEYWGFEKERLIELDWYENATLDDEFMVHCLPARHFSGRGLKSNQTLWASFLFEAPGQKIYMSGDSGYDTHFAEIGKQYPDIDLAILENGQYNDDWRYIHLMPEYMSRAAKDLKAKKILTVHHSKYALAKHRWDEPLKNAQKMAHDSLDVLTPTIGEVVYLREQRNK